jgi:regulator of protease activity HflC (stomatin/prohibitin superfamily)
MVQLSSFVLGIVLIIAAFIVFLVARSGRAVAGRPALSRLGKQVGTLAAVGLLIVGLFSFGSSFLRVVPANSVGIPTTFGKVGSPLSSGIHVTAPWTEITPFSTRIQELSMLRAPDEGDKAKDDSVTVIALGGGSMSVDVTVRFALANDKASELFRQAGTLQLVKDRFVRPDAREVIRNVFGQFTAEEGYSTKRAIIATKVTDELKPRLEARGILVDSVNIRDVAPDQQQLAAINAILQSRNEAAKALEDQKKQTTEAETRKQVASLDKQATVTKAEADAAAVTIAAQAQADANSKIAASLTPSLLDLEKTKACASAIAQTKAQVVNVCAEGGSGGGGGVNAPTSVIVDSRGTTPKA